MAGAQVLIAALKKGLGDGVRVQPVPCVGRCQHAPVAVVGQNPIDHAVTATVLAAVQAGAIEAPVTDYIPLAKYQSERRLSALSGLRFRQALR